MSGTNRAGSYRTLLANRTIARTFLLASVGRGGYATLPLLLLFTINEATGSFRLAALSISCYGFTTFLMPVKSRLIDKQGARIVLPILGTGLLTVLLAMTLAAALQIGPTGCWPVFGVLAGLAAPPLGPAMRAQWRRLAGDRLQLAYSLDAVVEEVLYLLGPVIAGAGIAIGPAWHVLALPPVLILVGCLGLALSPVAGAAPTAPDGAKGSRRSALRHTSLWPVLALMAAVGVAGALLSTGVAALAAAHDTPEFAGIAEFAIAVGAVTGGLLWGRHQVSWPWTKSAACLLGPWAVFVALAGAAGVGMPILGCLLIAGAVGAPLWIIAFIAAEHATPQAVRTEANTWVTTVYNLGSTGGTAAAGMLSAVVIQLPLFAAGAIAATGATCLATLPRITRRRRVSIRSFVAPRPPL
ncbi:hypothetical protein [Flexivirga sp. B27]